MNGAPASAIVLAGGMATRLGGDKAGRELRGRTLLENSLQIARAACDDIVVASGARSFDVPSGVRLALDDPAHAGAGPLAGVAAGLAAARNDRVLVLACDLPNVTPQLVGALLAALEDADCAYCSHAADEPLLAAMRRDAARLAVGQALAARRYKVIPVWQSLNPRVLSGSALARYGDPARLFANVNTPQDLERESGA